MRVMAASMRDAGCVRSVWQSRVFPHGKRIHVGPREDSLSFTVPQDADNSGTTNPIDDFVAELLEFRRRERRSFTFLKTQLRMRMNIFVNTFLPSAGFTQTRQDFRD